jgi:hypothetical protein
MATVIDLALAYLFLYSSPKAYANQIPAQYEGIGPESSVCMNIGEDDSCLAETIKNISIEEAVPASNDPNLKEMPNHFKAYVRPDISTFYKEKPGSRKPSSHVFNGQAGKFINMTPDRLNLYW